MFKILFPFFFIGILLLIFIKSSIPKTLFGSRSTEIGFYSYKHWITVTLNIYELMKRTDQGQIVGIEIENTCYRISINKMELPADEVNHLIDALQRG